MDRPVVTEATSFSKKCDTYLNEAQGRSTRQQKSIKKGVLSRDGSRNSFRSHH